MFTPTQLITLTLKDTDKTKNLFERKHSSDFIVEFKESIELLLKSKVPFTYLIELAKRSLYNLR